MPSNRATINDVAREAGVSKSSVSAVMNGRPGVSPPTRARVLEVMSRLNYRPSGAAIARSSSRKRRALGMVIKEMDNPYYTEVAIGARTEGRKHGYTLLVVSSEGDYEAEREAVELLCEQGVEGLILTPILTDDTDLSHLFELKRRNYPLVLLEEIRGLRASLVDIENVDASRQAVEHLMSLGHTRIVHFAGPEYSMHSTERLEGVHRAFSRSRQLLPDEAIVPAGAHLEDGYRTGLAYFRDLSEEERPTAVTCYNDLVALGLLRALGELGLRVPDDVSVIGYDDLAMLDYLPVPLSSVHVPKQEMGRRATELLIRQIESPDAVAPVREYLTGQLILRDSVRSLLPTATPQP
jgi:LacI family transcriptional regulator